MKKSPMASNRPNIAVTPQGGIAGAHGVSPYSRLSPLPPPLHSHLSDDTSSLPWNAAQVRADLHIAAQLLSDHNLKIAAKFAIEQWMGLPAEIVSDATITTSSPWIPSDYIVGKYQKETCPAVLYAKTLMDLGEYAHAAATLSQPSHSKTVETMPAPLADLSVYGFYLRAYALYMAGERRKEEEYMELKGEGQQHNPSFNPYIKQLLHELFDAYEEDKLDAFGLYVYGMVLLAGRALPQLPNAPSAQAVLMKSIQIFPYNWSAWLDLTACALEDGHIEQEIGDYLQPLVSDHFMYHFFCAHLQAERQAHEVALNIYEQWMDQSLFGASLFLLTQYGVMQYHMRQFSIAKSMLGDLHDHHPYRLDSMEILSNILYVQQDSVSLSQLAHTAVKVDKYRAETCCIVGNYYSMKQQRAKAIQYFQRAVKIDRNFTSAWTLMGHEYVEWKRTANATEAYRRALQVSPNDYRAYYGLGQVYECLNMSLYALHYYKRATQLRPFDARMWCALGTTFDHMARPNDAIRAFERAIQQDDTEGVATQKLAALYKKIGEVEKAAQCYLRHLELRHQATNPHGTASGGAGLDSMLYGLAVEAPEAEALLYLAHYHKEHKEFDTAALFCSRLLEYAGPEKEQAKAMLRELRQRSAVSHVHARHTRSKGPPPPSLFSP
ncbi:hypothetical protein MPSEU_000536800 [Mayamaea pseudoterrestris]|nr:hypothetical protein MPSEU_000536800 [Mayamaea pseudoterrestris]